MNVHVVTFNNNYSPFVSLQIKESLLEQCLTCHFPSDEKVTHAPFTISMGSPLPQFV